MAGVGSSGRSTRRPNCPVTAQQARFGLSKGGDMFLRRAFFAIRKREARQKWTQTIDKITFTQ